MGRGQPGVRGRLRNRVRRGRGEGGPNLRAEAHGADTSSCPWVEGKATSYSKETILLLRGELHQEEAVGNQIEFVR